MSRVTGKSNLMKDEGQSGAGSACSSREALGEREKREKKPRQDLWEKGLVEQVLREGE